MRLARGRAGSLSGAVGDWTTLGRFPRNGNRDKEFRSMVTSERGGKRLNNALMQFKMFLSNG
jgi:hypothetical protein